MYDPINIEIHFFAKHHQDDRRQHMPMTRHCKSCATSKQNKLKHSSTTKCKKDKLWIEKKLLKHLQQEPTTSRPPPLLACLSWCLLWSQHVPAPLSSRCHLARSEPHNREMSYNPLHYFLAGHHRLSSASCSSYGYGFANRLIVLLVHLATIVSSLFTSPLLIKRSRGSFLIKDEIMLKIFFFLLFSSIF